MATSTASEATGLDHLKLEIVRDVEATIKM
jgi:hypothetical protein